jgi:CBS domain containing-hemolysin-like protein
MAVCGVGRSLDVVLGVVHVKDLRTPSLGSEPVDMRAAMRGPLVVPGHTRVLSVLALVKQTRSHLALVVDEYGVVQGLVTCWRTPPRYSRRRGVRSSDWWRTASRRRKS